VGKAKEYPFTKEGLAALQKEVIEKNTEPDVAGDELTQLIGTDLRKLRRFRITNDYDVGFEENLLWFSGFISEDDLRTSGWVIEWCVNVMLIKLPFLIVKKEVLRQENHWYDREFCRNAVCKPYTAECGRKLVLKEQEQRNQPREYFHDQPKLITWIDRAEYVAPETSKRDSKKWTFMVRDLAPVGEYLVVPLVPIAWTYSVSRWGVFEKGDLSDLHIPTVQPKT